MKRNLFNLGVKAGQFNEQKVRVILAISALALFVLGAGAPGGFSGH